jgi:preprotein translocase subunit SecE
VTKKDVVIRENTENKETAKGAQFTAFFQETKEELGKVVWPSRQQLIGESAAVMLMVSLVATVIYLVDNLFSWLGRQPFLFGS